MNIKTMAAALILAVAVPVGAMAQGGGKTAKGRKKARWTRLATRLDDKFFTTAEAARIGDNLLFYQHESGGWPKNMRLQEELTDSRRERVEEMKRGTHYATIDNGATTTEMTYLARLYNATKDDKYRDAFMRGFDYLLEAQYPNGGWPQFYPLPKGYYTHITYNDDAMVHVLNLLRDVAYGEEPFTFLSADVRAKAKAAMDKGVGCILNTQVVQDGRKTVWCAQYDENTLQPVAARAYELVSLSGSESQGIVFFLMSLRNPSEAVCRCVDDAVAWFHKSEITGIRLERYTNEDGKRDVRVVPCDAGGKGCKPLWARFYTIDGNRPFFCDRDGVMKFNLSEIGHERRNGYSWYNSGGIALFKRYEAWKRENRIL